MIYQKQSLESKTTYVKNIEAVSSLSLLFTEEDAAPYIVSRSSEILYCNSFGATNLGRDDSAIDAILGDSGVGIKTFLHDNGNTLQKIAEFNRNSHTYRDLNDKQKILRIAQLRNDRLQFAIDNYDVSQLIYHCVTRKKNGLVSFYEMPMDFISIDNIEITKSTKSSIFFSDGLNEYTFNLSKSTLMMRFPFVADDFLVDKINVKILEDPTSLLTVLLGNLSIEEEYVILPLFSPRDQKKVNLKSGLNQWNAGGRLRNSNEVYIPISIKIHKKFPNFFPDRDVSFILHLPNRKTLNVKVCQDNNKALMSNPNKDLGEWLLRDVLRLEERELLTYSKLEDLNIDSVKITKVDTVNYKIDFQNIGVYDKFKSDNGL